MIIVKSKLRSTMKQERPNVLLFLFIEQELIWNINIEDVIDNLKIFRQKEELDLPQFKIKKNLWVVTNPVRYFAEAVRMIPTEALSQ